MLLLVRNGGGGKEGALPVIIAEELVGVGAGVGGQEDGVSVAGAGAAVAASAGGCHPTETTRHSNPPHTYR